MLRHCAGQKEAHSGSRFMRLGLLETCLCWTNRFKAHYVTSDEISVPQRSVYGILYYSASRSKQGRRHALDYGPRGVVSRGSLNGKAHGETCDAERAERSVGIRRHCHGFKGQPSGPVIQDGRRVTSWQMVLALHGECNWMRGLLTVLG